MNIIKRILPYFRYMKPVRVKFLLGILFGVMYSISSGLGLPLMAEYVFPILFSNTSKTPEWVFNFAQTYFNGNINGGFLLICCMALPAVIFVRTIGAIGNGYFITYTGIYVVQAIQLDMFKKVQSLPLSFFNGYKTGEINAAVMGYPNQIKEIIVDTCNDLIKEPLTLISAVGFLIYKSFTSQSFFMAIIGFASVPLIIFIVRRVGSYLATRSRQLVTLGESLGSWVIECFQSPIEIRAYNLQKVQIENFKNQLKKIFQISMKSTRFGLIMSPSIELISGIGFSIALFLGVQYGMAEGEFIALIVALYMAYNPIKKIGGIQNAIKILEAPLDRLEAVLHAKDKIEPQKDCLDIPKPIKGSLTFENICFEYQTNKKVLEHINVTIPENKRIGLVGKSGSGKSTFVNLILRLYDPTEGRILLDGIDIKRFKIEELRELIAYVPQTPLLFNASIADNIKVGNPNASEEEVINAARQAHAHNFIMEKPEGYNTMISERGISLSGGQRQRISIARAFLKNAPILILDEATSSLDSVSDKEITSALLKLTEEKTAIVISHRNSTLSNIDDRVYFENGKISAVGKHHELIKTSPEYRKLIDKKNID
jgi:subfamily B ATP-binding cassette protein MsbA